MKRIIFTSILILLSCDNSSLMGPTPPPEPPPPVDGQVPPPVSRGIQFSWNDTRGLLIFAGTQARENQIKTLDARLRELGWPTPTYNVCSETTEWESTPWADGPPALGKKNLANLQRFLATTATLGSQVRLNIFCTLRDNKGWMGANWKQYTTKVATIAKEFDHVFLSIANEPYHPNSWFKNRDGRLRAVRDAARAAGFQGWMGADDNLGCPDPTVCSFDYAYRQLGFTPDFHPFRNPDPGHGVLTALVEANGLPLVISEPTAYSSWREGRCCTDNREQIVNYMHRVERLGMVFFFHSTDGLEWPQKPHFDWIVS